jgi:hypothetical protein
MAHKKEKKCILAANQLSSMNADLMAVNELLGRRLDGKLTFPT